MSQCFQKPPASGKVLKSKLSYAYINFSPQRQAQTLNKYECTYYTSLRALHSIGLILNSQSDTFSDWLNQMVKPIRNFHELCHFEILKYSSNLEFRKKSWLVQALTDLSEFCWWPLCIVKHVFTWCCLIKSLHYCVIVLANATFSVHLSFYFNLLKDRTIIHCKQ